jgi:hypothetical protein
MGALKTLFTLGALIVLVPIVNAVMNFLGIQPESYESYLYWGVVLVIFWLVLPKFRSDDLLR